jgi:hypothetical protein
MTPNDLHLLAQLLALPLAMTIDPFAPFLIFGVCLRLGWITDPHLTRPEFAGFGSPVFLAAAGCLYVLHALADKFPPIGHFFDLVGSILKPLAAAAIGLWLSNRIAPPEDSLH